MMQLYPEIYSCIGCNACTKSCSQGLNVMQYIAYGPAGRFRQVRRAESFDCVMCGICSSRCPAGISHPQVAELARRLNGKYLMPEAKHLTKRVKEIEDGLCQDAMEAIMAKPIERTEGTLQPQGHREIKEAENYGFHSRYARLHGEGGSISRL